MPPLKRRGLGCLGLGLSRVLGAYRSWNLCSYNFALAGGGPRGADSGYQVLLKIVSRANPEPDYRSDVTYFERLHGEAVIDVSPEEVAERLRPAFA